ncbi:hypothetical protein Mcup_1835 [Metallosphaera cuprina Ar-4]|uniref:Uncharacterized protein n=1 Tax=Metallosphaera cuprina (strain Ar-4) TaxID=1006006 RepID=F4G0X8_METCR|nr:hypothetical protein Mcup_1835 [Metallosphaera cuprina Ar-4]
MNSAISYMVLRLKGRLRDDGGSTLSAKAIFERHLLKLPY